MITILLNVLILVLVIGVIWWLLDFMPVPDPFNKIAKVIITVVALIILIYMLLDLAGQAPSLRVR